MKGRIRELARIHGARNVRLIGSVARGEERRKLASRGIQESDVAGAVRWARRQAGRRGAR